MPRPKTDTYWENRIRTLAEQGKNPAAIVREFAMEAAEGHGRNDWPSERTIRRICDRHNKSSHEERRQYSLFRWPDSMEAAGLPWEASPSALALLRQLHSDREPRPTVGVVRWFWRVCLATPNLDRIRGHSTAREVVKLRFRVAGLLVNNERIQTAAGELPLPYSMPDSHDDRPRGRMLLGYVPRLRFGEYAGPSDGDAIRRVKPEDRDRSPMAPLEHALLQLINIHTVEELREFIDEPELSLEEFIQGRKEGES